jgi:rubrerythrin
MEYWISHHDVAVQAADLEAKCAQFYKRLGRATTDPVVRKLCGIFEEEERQHQSGFRMIASAHQGDKQTHCHPVDLLEMVKTTMQELDGTLERHLATPGVPLDLDAWLTLARFVESRSISLYSPMVEMLDERFSPQVVGLVVSEQHHLRKLRRVQRHRRNEAE